MLKFLSSAGSKPSTTSTSPSSFVDCPLCSKAFSKHQIASHASLCSGAGEDIAAAKKPRLLDDDDAERNEREENHGVHAKEKPEDQLADEEEEDEPSADHDKLPNALQVLMANSRQKREYMVLDLTTGAVEYSKNNCIAHPLATWTGTCQIRNPKAAPTVMHLALLPNCGDLAEESAPKPLQPITKVSKLSVGTLKSILQKAIRRRDADTAQRAACELVSKKWSDLLRRLPIIILEDSALCQGFDALVFLMMAHAAGLPPCPDQVALVVNLVIQVASCPYYDDGHAASNALSDDEVAGLSLTSLKFVRCMQIRASYGGMTGDVKMCLQFARLWCQRFLDHKDFLFQRLTVKLPRVNYVGFADPGQYNVSPSLLAGIDSHCQPRLFDPLVSESGIARDVFDAMMWTFRSSIRLRLNLSEVQPGSQMNLQDKLREVEKRAQLCEKGQVENIGFASVWAGLCDSVEAISARFVHDMIAI